MRTRLTAIAASVFLAGFVFVVTGGAPALGLGVRAAGSSPAPSASSSPPPEGIQGTVRGPAGPLAGVRIAVAQNGTEIGSATTDKAGQWLIAVPKAGTYQVTLDVTSLPKSVQLVNKNGATIPALVVQPDSIKFAIFPLTKAGAGAGGGGGGGGGSSGGGGTGTGQLQYYVSVAVAGLEFGLIIAMTAVGLSLIFGTTRLINFAHGELVTIGAVLAYVFGTSPFAWPFAIAIILAIVGVALLGGILELGLWRPLRKRSTGLIQMFIISIGLSLLLRNGIQYLFGTQREQYQQATTETPLTLGPLSIAPRDLVIILVSIVVLIAIAVMLQRTRMGKAMRALADNHDLAEASGINVDRVVLQVWIIGGALAAVGGVLFGLTTAVSFDMGFHLLLLMFAGIILGGLGSAYGAMLGSIVIGLVAQFSTVWFPAELENAWAMLVLIVVLLVRPQGILGRLQRAG